MKPPRCCFCDSQAGPLVGVPLLPCRPSDDEWQPRLLACADLSACGARMSAAGLTPRNEIDADTGRQTLERVFLKVQGRQVA